MTDVILRFDYIDDEVMWPEFDAEDRLKVGWIKATSGVRRMLLNVSQLRKRLLERLTGL